MGRHDWYRKTTWTDADRTDFESRLKRSRGAFHRAQYLNIQASILSGTGESALAEVALGLLQRVLDDSPSETWLHTSVWLTRGDCLVSLGRLPDALIAYENAIAARAVNPNFLNDAHLRYGELALRLGRSDLYDRVLALLDDPVTAPVFPVQRFRASSLRALIADLRGDRSAASHAREALEAAALTESPFRYHRQIGLVARDAPDVASRLRYLAALAAG